MFLGVLNGLGARIVPVDTDEDGMRPDALEAQLQQIEAAGELDRVKLIYLVSYYENPSGVSLSAERRPVAPAPPTGSVLPVRPGRSRQPNAPAVDAMMRIG